MATSFEFKVTNALDITVYPDINGDGYTGFAYIEECRERGENSDSEDDNETAYTIKLSKEEFKLLCQRMSEVIETFNL